jgi:hypothetical protein
VLCVDFSAILFAAHHMSLSGMIPLATLGFLWVRYIITYQYTSYTYIYRPTFSELH